jgi:glycosyltransferase involved in cell wall biosynthesis
MKESQRGSNSLVCVCMITYNQQHFIGQAIEGILMQKTNFSFKLTIGDDCSTDDTRQICLKYAELFPDRVRILPEQENLGAIRNFTRTLNQCDAKYIALCEGDDYWTDPYKLQKQVDFLEANEDYGLVWTDVDFLVQSKGVFSRSVFKNKLLQIYTTLTDTLINKPFFSPPTWVFRSEYIPTGINDYCDGTFPMILDILNQTKIKYLDEVTAVYRELDESASHSKTAQKRYKFLKGVYEIQKDYFKKCNLSTIIGEEIDLKYYTAAYPYAVILGDSDTINKARMVIKNNHQKGLKMKVILFLSDFIFGIQVLKLVYNNEKLKKFSAKLSVFRHE